MDLKIHSVQDFIQKVFQERANLGASGGVRQ